MMNVPALKKDFPILQKKVHGKPLVYLDNAATTQKPQAVIDALSTFYREHNANVHRAAYALAEEATAAFEEVRDKVRKFLHIPEREGIVFTRGTTEGINLIAYSYGRTCIKEGDRILITLLEHHSNIIPWQQLAREKKAKLLYCQLNEDGTLDEHDFQQKLELQPKIVSLSHMSNVLGTILPVEKLARLAKHAGACVVIDGAQSVPHLPINVSKIPCDFYVFSGHKMLGPTGVGVLYGKPEVLDLIPPFLTGGEMIKKVELDDATWNDLPHKFEAGTPNIAPVIGLGAAIDYLSHIGMDRVREHEKALVRYALDKLQEEECVHLFPPYDESIKGGVISFTYEGIHPHDLATILDQEGIAIRSGHHCAQPLMRHLGVPATARLSFSIYNDTQDIETLILALRKARTIFSRV